ncbi:hyaluronate lyase [Ignicoccus hospitalis]|uniref:Nickel-dependent hydrogenase small subunit, N-terminal domain protein n=1 Tax=Ignicoccus hospitalis (strain KIN4/I / DSM 18386 / JCM 14125) TaxID=453591 RepID=A8AC90_IGNH4|nr:hyaluronate lyase [Ignicoccus hospitalis]ABU82542.1 Nickel-dependent hydrogenase small subunit, N-terminal domain protein [Ignicoccus hospitalis KIN4/I]HIH90707.1 hyaluronate lyase [Desulfurococcaceae archaeon]
MSVTKPRREFLKKLGASTLLLGALSNIDWANAMEMFKEAVRKGKVNIVWFEAQSCTGDTTSLIQATDPDLVEVLTGAIHLAGPGTVGLAFHDTVMPEWGEGAIEILKLAESGAYDPFVLVIEGSIPDENHARKFCKDPNRCGYYCFVGEENGRVVTCTEWIHRLAKRAVAVVAAGTCASYGGIPSNKVLEPPPGWSYPEWSLAPTGAVGFFDDPVKGYKGLISRHAELPNLTPYFNYIFRDCEPELSPGSTCKPAVAVPGCPTNGNGILRVLVHLVLAALYPDVVPLPRASEWLDQYARPKYLFGRTVHEQCPRAGYYAAGDLRRLPGDNDAKCLFAVGCKGPAANCPWNKVGWVNGVGGPTRTGGVCIGCTMPGFSDAFEPFYKPLPAPAAPSAPEALATAVGAAAIGAVVGYALTKKAKG